MNRSGWRLDRDAALDMQFPRGGEAKMIGVVDIVIVDTPEPQIVFRVAQGSCRPIHIVSHRNSSRNRIPTSATNRSRNDQNQY